jgi:AcrR family transcriptional regulator
MSAMATRTATPRQPRRPSARARLLEAADELFYREGVQSVGIDRVIEHAGVAKASLYNVFGSKEELVHAYLHERRAATTARITAAVEQHDDPREKILAVFESQAAHVRKRDFRGCAFAGASAEARPGGLVQEATRDYRGWFRDLFTDLARQAGAPDPELLGRQLQLLYDGALSSANLDHDLDAPQAALGAAAALLAAVTT